MSNRIKLYTHWGKFNTFKLKVNIRVFKNKIQNAQEHSSHLVTEHINCRDALAAGILEIVDTVGLRVKVATYNFCSIGLMSNNSLTAIDAY